MTVIINIKDQCCVHSILGDMRKFLLFCENCLKGKLLVLVMKVMVSNQKTEIPYKVKFGMPNPVLPYFCDTNNFAIPFYGYKKRFINCHVKVYNCFHK